MQERYRIKPRPIAIEENVVIGSCYRITMLTEGLVRLEYSEDGIFEDRATQMAFYRDFPKTNYRVIHTKDGIEIFTSQLHLVYNEGKFSGNGLSIQVNGNLSPYHSIWRYGEAVHDLKGTARTLDEADGAIELEHGIVSWFGYSVLDDSCSQVLLEDGWVEPRKKGIEDLYFFGYGHDYKEALKGFYALCGKTPMLPRYALGNWWSRYYQYSENSYLELMDRFEKEKLPFTVAVIDMDWHLVDIDPKYGSGWTGFTWNKELFPDPERFLKNLHERGMQTALNTHPADGVRAYEEMYEEMARKLGVDFENEDPILCDPADPEFIEAYFTYLHHPYEEMGVDFWWIDWQQGSTCKVEGLDPLWIFNHFYFLDNKRSGKRPMTFSRYAGPGSHRYPVGFSGDTLITWDSLDFQPYFTATASNIGYGWWSHDIGGHMMGYKNDEMEARWFQFGVFSPVNRLHSSKSEFNGKEPWRFKTEVREVMGKALRQRHRMIPYLYSMNYRSYKEDLPLIEPMYYEHPENRAAYEAKNQYYFGSELIVAPVTSPRIEGLNVAKTKVWLPEGTWYDLETGMIYNGGRTLNLYRGLESIPVLAKAGGILVFTEEIEAKEVIANPSSFVVSVYGRADGRFILYEDDNETCDYEKGICVKTGFAYQEGEEAVFTIEEAVGDLSLIPKERDYTIKLTGYGEAAAKTVKVLTEGLESCVSYEKRTQAVVVVLKDVCTDKGARISVRKELQTRDNLVSERVFDFLNQAEIDFTLKDQIYEVVQSGKSVGQILGDLNAMGIHEDLYGALLELFTAVS